MIHVSLSLPDDVGAVLEIRARDGGYADLADYLQALAEAEAAGDQVWEVSPEIAAALDEGERSGISARSLDQIFNEARALYYAASK